MNADETVDFLEQNAVEWIRGNRFEDFALGQKFTHHWGRTVTESDNTLFSTLTLAYNPAYTNASHARAQGLQGSPVNPLLVFNVVFGLSVEDLVALEVPLLVTSSHQGDLLHKAVLPWPCAWVLGHEGQGVSSGLEAMAAQSVRIAQPGGEESLNVAAAAAVCLHASATAMR